METLYKKSSNNIQQWEAKIEATLNGINLVLLYGQINGKLIENKRVVQGKNIGKSNQTSGYSQAQSEIESLIKKKADEGYKTLNQLGYNYFIDGDDIEKFLLEVLPDDTTDANDNLKPMKAQQYYRSKANWIGPDGITYIDRKYYYISNPYVNKEKDAIIIKFPCLAQPKVNGVRCFIMLKNDKVLMLSKEGKEYDIKHIKTFFEDNKNLFKVKYKDTSINLIYDGELYLYGGTLQRISSAVKKYNIDTPQLTFNIFDLGITDYKQIDRFKILKYLNTKLIMLPTSPVLILSSDVVNNDKEAQEHCDKSIKQGFEGSIFRDFNSTYQFGKRRPNMVKLKRTISNEYKIIDIVPQKKDNSLGLYLCQTKEGEVFEVTPKGGRDFQYTLLLIKHNYINKFITLVFYEYTESMKPLHIIDMIIRDYE